MACKEVDILIKEVSCCCHVWLLQVGLKATDKVAVRDLYDHADKGTFTGSYSAFVNPSGGVVMLKLTPTPAEEKLSRAAEVYIL